MTRDADAKGRRGTAMVETLIVLPVLLVTLFGVIEFGIAFQRWQVLVAAAREGARAASVQVSSCDQGEVEAVIERYVAAAGLTPEDVEIHVDPLCVERGTPIEVRVRHAFTFPVLSGLVPTLSHGVPLRGVSVMRKE